MWMVLACWFNFSVAKVIIFFQKKRKKRKKCAFLLNFLPLGGSNQVKLAFLE